MGGGVTYALEASANEVDTHKEWKPEGSIIAQGEDGVPWELYENGYLLFKPEVGKNTFVRNNNLPSWRNKSEKIKAIGFKYKTYLGDSFYGRLTFANLKNLEYFNGKNLYASQNKDEQLNFFGMFLDNTNLKYVDLSNMDMSKVRNLKSMFAGNESLESLDVSNWNVSNVENFDNFIDGTNIKKLDLSRWKFKENSKRRLIQYLDDRSLEEISLPESLFLNEDEVEKYIVDGEVPNVYNFFHIGINSKYDAYKSSKVGNLNWIRKEDKKEIRDFAQLKINDKSNAGTWTRRYSKIHFSGGEDIKPPVDIVEFSNKFTDESMLLPEPANKVIKDEETDDYYIFTGWTAEGREIEEVEKGGALKDMPVKTISDVTELYKTIFKTIDTIKGDEYLTYTVRPRYEKIENVKREQLPIKPTVLYKGDETLDKGQSEETDGTPGKKEVVTIYKTNPITGELTELTTTENVVTPMTPKIIKLGTKPTVTTIERDNKQIKQTTTYIVNEDTGELTPNTTEEIIGNVKPTTSNGTEAPLTFELPEYTNPISTNTPIDENGELVLPPTVDKLEYTGTLSTNTPVDKDDNLILPPIVEIPEYKVDIVNEPQKVTKEKLEPKDNNKQTPTEIYHKSDKKQDVTQDTVNTIESDNNNVVQKQVLPKTNAFYSTPYVLGLLLSTVGFKQNKKE